VGFNYQGRQFYKELCLNIKSRGKNTQILKSSFEFEYLRKFAQIICAAILLDREQQYDPTAKRIN
jgi:hypothetical protein